MNPILAASKFKMDYTNIVRVTLKLGTSAANATNHFVKLLA